LVKISVDRTKQVGLKCTINKPTFCPDNGERLNTLIPFAHWLPLRIRFWIYKKLGREHWADVNHLNLLTLIDFLSLFPRGIKVKLYKQKLFLELQTV